jgi:hypothetical protein
MFVENPTTIEILDPSGVEGPLLLPMLQTYDSSGINFIELIFPFDPNPEDLHVCRKWMIDEMCDPRGVEYPCFQFLLQTCDASKIIWPFSPFW